MELQHEPIGAVEVLRVRVYPLDPATASHPNSTGVVVEPGHYALFRVGDARYWVMTGRRNGRLEKFGDGLFLMGGGDRGSGPVLTFPSPTFGPDQWAALLAEPAFTDGHPDQRLRVLDGGESR